MDVKKDFKEIFGKLPSNYEQQLELLKLLIEEEGVTIKKSGKGTYEIVLHDFGILTMDEYGFAPREQIKVGPYDFETLILASYLRVLDEWGEEVCYNIIDNVRRIIGWTK